MGLGGGGVFCPGSPVFGLHAMALDPVPGPGCSRNLAVRGGRYRLWKAGLEAGGGAADSVSGLCGERGSWMERGLLAPAPPTARQGWAIPVVALGFERLRRRLCSCRLLPDRALGSPGGAEQWCFFSVPGSAFAVLVAFAVPGEVKDGDKICGRKIGGQWNRRGDSKDLLLKDGLASD